MRKTLSEVEVLRWFEEGPIEKVEVVFHIVAEKMRERLGGRHPETHTPAKETGATRRRREQPGTQAQRSGEAPLQEPAE